MQHWFYLYKITFSCCTTFFNLQWFVKLMQYLAPKVPKTRFSIRGSRGILRYWRHITQRSHQSSERKLCVVVLYYNSIHSIPDQFHTATFNVIFFPLLLILLGFDGILLYFDDRLLLFWNVLVAERTVFLFRLNFFPPNLC